MHTVTANRLVAAPVEDVWTAIDDFGAVYRFHPYIESSHTTNDVTHGTGAQRQCDFYSGESIREEVVETVDQRRQVVEIFDTGSFPMHSAVATIELEPRGDETNVTMSMSFDPKYGPVGWLLARLVMRRQFQTVLSGVLEGLDAHLESGKFVAKRGELVDEKAGTHAQAA